jgi:hypothetical protein
MWATMTMKEKERERVVARKAKKTAVIWTQAKGKEAWGKSLKTGILLQDQLRTFLLTLYFRMQFHHQAHELMLPSGNVQ